MRAPFRALLRIATAAIIIVVAAAFCNGAALSLTQRFSSSSGIVLLGYAPRTNAKVFRDDGHLVWHGVLTNDYIQKLPLSPGRYTLVTDDEVVLVSNDLNAYETPPLRLLLQRQGGGSVREQAGPLTVLQVPWVGDKTFADSRPGPLSRHPVFRNVDTRLKAVVKGGRAPYRISWDYGDGAGFRTPFTTSDGYAGASARVKYDLPIGTYITALVRVTDADNVTASGSYHMRVADAGSVLQRSNRAADEALWYLHTQMVRQDNVSRPGEPPVDEGYVPSRGVVACSAMSAICLENSGRAIVDGKALSNDPTKDAYVEDLVRLINFLTDKNTLIATAPGAPKIYPDGPFNPDTHPAGGNGVLLHTNVDKPIYEGGMHLQAICQAGLTGGDVPNRIEYNDRAKYPNGGYYALIGDFVDGFQYAQAVDTSMAKLGGWRYDFSYGDADGSAVVWATIGLRAAELAHTLTPGPPLPPIGLAAPVTSALNVWLAASQDTDAAGIFRVLDYRTGQDRNAHLLGGFGYQRSGEGPNAAKTGGGLVGLRMLRIPPTSPRVQNALSFLYRHFFAKDGIFGWASARDSYGMYNLLKGLVEYNVVNLSDPLASGGKDLDGLTAISFNWHTMLADFIAGRDSVDLGHQAWPNNRTLFSRTFSETDDGHFEPNGTRNKPYGPLLFAEWAMHSADANSGPNLVTAWDIGILQGSIFTPPPIAVILHPDTAAGETYVPDKNADGTAYLVTFDPATSFDLNPSAQIVHVAWDFGDGAPILEYDLPFPGPLGGAVPSNPANTVQHAFVIPNGETHVDRTVTLTVTDLNPQLGESNTNSTSVVVHVQNEASPVAQMRVTSVDTEQSGDTISVKPDGTVTMRFNASDSYNPRPDAVQAPKNSNGISSFAFEWPRLAGGTPTSDPINPAGPYNDGNSELPNLFDEGVADGSGELNPGSRAAVQTYRFQFDPNRIPSSILIGLRVKSNLTLGIAPDTSTIYKQVFLKLGSGSEVSADLGIMVSADPDPVLVNSTLTYTLLVTNYGPDDASNILVTDNLPAEVKYVSGAADHGGIVGGSGNNRTVTFASLNVGETAVITLRTTAQCSVMDGRQFDNTPTVTSDTPDPDLSNNVDVVRVSASNPPPDVRCPQDINAENDRGKCSAVLKIDEATAIAPCPDVTVSGARSDGLKLTDPYPVGATTITWTVKDAFDRTASCMQKITVRDTEPPEMQCPDPICVPVVAGACSATVNLGRPFVTDNCPGEIRIVGLRDDGKPLTDPFPLGYTLVNWWAYDAAGNEGYCYQQVLIINATPPIISEVKADPSILTPPDNRMVLVTLDYTVMDYCVPEDKLKLELEVTSTEVMDPSDYEILDPHHLMLRAKADPLGDGRIYFITVRCFNGDSGVGYKVVDVYVPPQ